MNNGYIAFVLDDDSRKRILKQFPPKHSDVICHHITMKFGIPEPNQTVIDYFNYEFEGKVKAVAYVFDDKAEALIVMINGTMINYNSYYHITVSIDRSKKVKPVYSNELIANTTNTTIYPPIYLSGKVEFIPFI